MPISPAPPSGANTSSSSGDVISSNGSKLPRVGWVEPPGPASGRPDDKLKRNPSRMRHRRGPSWFLFAQPILPALTQGKHSAPDDRLTFAPPGPHQPPTPPLPPFQTPSF